MRISLFRVVPALVMSGLAFGLIASNAYAQTTYSGGPGGALVDATTAVGVFTSDIVVSGTGATITTFDSVAISGFTHTWLGDLEVRLTNVATAATVVLMSPPDGESTDLNGNYIFRVNAGLSTIDQAAAALTGAQAVASGAYAISGYGGGTAVGPRNTFDAFTGIGVDGTWRLTITDFANGDTGAIGGWAFSSFVSTPVVVPEANTFALALPALGMIGAVVIRRRKK